MFFSRAHFCNFAKKHYSTALINLTISCNHFNPAAAAAFMRDQMVCMICGLCKLFTPYTSNKTFLKFCVTVDL